MLQFNFDASKGETPASIAQKRALIAQLMGSAKSPQNVGEGFSAIGDGIVANVLGGRAREAEATGQESANSTFGALTAMLTGQGGATPSSGFGGAPANASTGAGGPNAYRDAIASIESAGSGDYSAIGPANDTLGRPLGRYQVMEANIGPWSREALGREITPDEFLASPELQDAIFDHRFGGYVDQFGPEGAAQAWFAGPGGVGQMGRKDVLGTSVSAYTDKFNNALGGAAPVQVASLDPSTGAPAQLPPVGPSGGPPLTAMPQQTAPAAPAPQPAPPAPVQTAQGPSLQMLMEAAANPWLNDSQKGIINSMIAQEMQKQDPAYQQQMQAGQLGIEKSQLELEAMRNPGKKPPIEVGGVLVDPDTFQPVFDSRTPADDGFTLSPGQQRFDAQGNPIAAAQPEPGFRQLSAEEATDMGLPPGKTFQVGPDNKISEIGGSGVTVNNNMGEGYTPGQKKIDEAFADTYLTWVGGGFADAGKQLGQLNEALAILETEGGVTGAVGVLPEFVQPFINERGTVAREQVEEVVQRTLRETLGAQFTEREGERLIARAFNPRLPPQENAKRVRRLIGSVQNAAEAKQEMVDYFQQNGTLRGYEGRRPDPNEITQLANQFEREDGGSDAGQPSAPAQSTVPAGDIDALLEKYQ